jgi:hypothetical protein
MPGTFDSDGHICEPPILWREYTERAWLIPQPRAHQVRYHGILAPAASLRDRVVPGDAVAEPDVSEQRGEPERGTSGQPADGQAAGDEERKRAYRMRWARLLMRVFEVDALRCPDCGARLRLLAAIEDPEVAAKILECVGLPSRAPPILPGQAGAVRVAGDSAGDDFDQTPAFADPW